MTYPLLQRPLPPPPLSVLLLLAILLFQVGITAVYGQRSNDIETETLVYDEEVSILFSTFANKSENTTTETPIKITTPVFESSTAQSTLNSIQESTVSIRNEEQLPSQPMNKCIDGTCIPYHQCYNTTSNTVANTDGRGLLNPRIHEDLCPSLNTCCPKSFDIIEKSPITDVDKRTTCGHRNVDGIGPRITGINVDTQYSEFPWMLALLKSKMKDHQENYTYLCGASLIHPKVALTATHCLNNKNISELILRAGEWDSKSRSEVFPHQDRFVSKIVKHKKYHAGSLANDITLIFLTTPFTLRDNVGTICLPPQDFKFGSELCFASGWGNEVFGKDGVYQNILRKVELPIVSRNMCLSKLRKSYLGPHYELSDTFICAGGELGKDTCKGDGGSPLVCPMLTNFNQYHQAGIVSWGVGCGTDIPGLYTDVSQFRNWIDQTMRSEGLDTSYYDASFIVAPLNSTN